MPELEGSSSSGIYRISISYPGEPEKHALSNALSHTQKTEAFFRWNI